MRKVTDREVWTAANQVIDQYDDDAEIHAAMMSDKFPREGDTIGHLTWSRILKAIIELKSKEVVGPTN